MRNSVGNPAASAHAMSRDDHRSANAAFRLKAFEHPERPGADLRPGRAVLDEGALGNWVAVEAIRQISISGKRPPIEKLGHIILAAPDIDVDVFKSQMRRIGAPKKPYLVMISKDDLALRVSSFLAGAQKRIGAAEDVAELTALGAVVVDLSDISSRDRLGHGKFADLASIGSDLPGVLQRGMNENRANGPGGAIGATMSVPLAVRGAPIKFISGQR